MVIYDFRQHSTADLILAQISTLGWYQSLIFIQSWDDTTCLSKRSLQQFSCFSSLKKHVAFYNTCTVLMKLNNVCDHHPIQIQKLKLITFVCPYRIESVPDQNTSTRWSWLTSRQSLAKEDLQSQRPWTGACSPHAALHRLCWSTWWCLQLHGDTFQQLHSTHQPWQSLHFIEMTFSWELLSVNLVLQKLQCNIVENSLSKNYHYSCSSPLQNTNYSISEIKKPINTNYREITCKSS